MALVHPTKYLQWPHVADTGLLCLEEVVADDSQPVEVTKAVLRSSLELISKCQNEDFIEREFRREFVSYWDRTAGHENCLVRSLLDPTTITKRISSYRLSIGGDVPILVAYAPDDLKIRYRHASSQDPSGRTFQSVVHLTRNAPVQLDKIPTNFADLFEWIASQSATAYGIVLGLLREQLRFVVVLSA